MVGLLSRGGREMELLMKRSSIALLCSAGALALLLAGTVPMTPAHAADVEDCSGTCPEPEGPDVSNPVPEAAESESVSEGGGQSEPSGDAESDTETEGRT